VFACLFDQLGLDAIAFEIGQIIDEDLAHQVIQFVLDAHCQQPLGLEFERLAVAIERAHGDALGALDLVENAGHRQAAFLAFFASGLRDDFGVDEHAQLVMGFGNVDDNDAFVNVDLGGGQTDAVRGVHGLRHVVDQLADARIHRLHRLGDGVQARIGVMQNVESGHKKLYE